MKIVVVGIGYVGISNAILLAQKNEVVAVDIAYEKVDMINRRQLPIIDEVAQEYLENKQLYFSATTDLISACENADYVIISTPTNYDSEKDYFDTSSVEKVVEQVLGVSSSAVVVIKSTVPVGYTKLLCEKYKTDRILFSPEFLREGKALYDNLYPSRIIVGSVSESKEMRIHAEVFAGLLIEGAIKKDISVLFMQSTEAEAVKLFANTYLAMRVSFFNELDTYAEMRNLDTKAIIEGICLDSRIGNHYNNPSFGYGGYCLPKDTKQLLSNYKDIPNNIMKAVVESNQTRKLFIMDRVLEMVGYNDSKANDDVCTVGIYRLSMKADSDNFRESSICSIMELLKEKGINIVVYEPTIKEEHFLGSRVIKDIKIFKEMSDVILANRQSEELSDVKDKVYTRDVYMRD